MTRAPLRLVAIVLRSSRVKKSGLSLVISLAAACALPAAAMTTDAQSIVRLIGSTRALVIDRSVPAPGGADPRTHPYVRVAGEQGFATGSVDAEFASIGRLAEGTQVMAVPLESGGSGGVFTQLIFAEAIDGAPYYAGYITSGGHLAVNVTYHGIVAISPHYGANDPNCCPSRYDRRTYTIAKRRLVLQSTETVKTP
jgi:hypothetical protein